MDPLLPCASKEATVMPEGKAAADNQTRITHCVL